MNMSFPNIRFPFYNNRRYPYGYYNRPYVDYNGNIGSDAEIHNAQVEEKKHTDKKDDRVVVDDVKIIEIFGLKLKFDDIILIGLIFFLYQEGVDDKELFISLILLLIT